MAEVEVCSNCGKTSDVVEDVMHPATLPTPGDFAMCTACGHVTAVGDNGRMRELNDSEIVALAGDKRMITLQRMRHELMKSNGPIERAWVTYLSCVSDNEQIRAEAKLAFFAGVVWLYSNVNDAKKSNEQFLSMMETIARELHVYAEEHLKVDSFGRAQPKDTPEQDGGFEENAKW